MSLNILVNKVLTGACSMSVSMKHPSHQFDNVIKAYLGSSWKLQINNRKPARLTAGVEFEGQGCGPRPSNENLLLVALLKM